jgi:N-acetylmuramoyl-L-alanine amidase
MFAPCILRLRVSTGLNIHDMQSVSLSDSLPMIAFRWLRIVCIFLVLTLSALAKPIVVIDAGHGGHDRGGMPGQRIPEKGYTLDVANRVESALKRAGFQTVMTRRSDVFISLGERCAMANRLGNAIFVSIHFNGARNYDAFGIETYYSSGSRSAGLASAIHRAVLSATGSMDRRVRSRGFFVLRRTNVPAVLCELGFLTNRDEAKKIASSSYRQKLADAVVRGIRARY